ncbi:MAG: nitroreductase family protein, partial [Candidatus Geothermarchaeales archaeon]
MEIHQFIKSRRSIRRYRDGAVPGDVLRRILDSARWAPSAHNAQPWRFIVVRNPANKRRLAEEMGEAWEADLSREGVPTSQRRAEVEASINFFESTPVLIVACITMEDMHRYPDERRQRSEHLMAVQSLSAAIQNMLLTAHSLGIGACWRCAPLFCQDVVRRVLNLPESFEPMAIIAMGYPLERPSPKPRMPLKNIVRFDR